MQEAQSEIVSLRKGGKDYRLSIVEKQNESGIYFNRRVLYLIDEEIGYVTKVPQTKEAISEIDFDVVKGKVEMGRVKHLHMSGKELRVVFMVENLHHSKVEKQWLFRMKSQELVDKWHSMLSAIKLQKMQETNQSIFKAVSSMVISDKSSRVSPPKKPLTITHLQPIKLTTSKKAQDVGVGMSPVNSVAKVQPPPPKQVDSREVGTVTSEAWLGEFSPPKSPKKSSFKVEQGNTYGYQPPQIENEESIAAPNGAYGEGPNDGLAVSLLARGASQIKKAFPSSQELSNAASNKLRRVEIDESSVVNSCQAEMAVSRQIQPRSTIKNYWQRTANLVQQSSTPYPKTMVMSRPGLSSTPVTARKAPPLTPVGNLMPARTQRSNIYISQSSQASIKHHPTQVPWTYLYLTEGETMFSSYGAYSQQLLTQILTDWQLPPRLRCFQPMAFENPCIAVYEFAEMECKIVMGGSREEEWQGAVKALQHEYKQFDAMYRWMPLDGRVKVPLVCLCEVHGCYGLFRLLPRDNGRTVRMREVDEALGELRERSNIDYNFYQKDSCVFIEVDEMYYSQFKPDHDSRPLNYIFLMQVDRYLPIDINYSQVPTPHLLRPQLLTAGQSEEQLKQEQSIPVLSAARLNQSRSQRYSSLLNSRVDQLAKQLDNFNLYFYDSTHLSQCFHRRGINLRYLGQLYHKINNPSQRKIIISQAAARSVKALVRAGLSALPSEASFAIRQDETVKLLNKVLSPARDGAIQWHILGQYCQSKYKLTPTPMDVNPTYFLGSVVEGCRLDIDWQYIHFDRAFQSRSFFNANNFKGMLSKVKMYEWRGGEVEIVERVVNEEQPNQHGFDELVSVLQLRAKTIPKGIGAGLRENIMRYLASFIHPSDEQFSHLQLYEWRQPPSILSCELQLTALRWQLREGDLYSCQSRIDMLINTATKFYGQRHPFFKQLYSILSEYHLASHNYEQAIYYSKSALVNLIDLCGHEHKLTMQGYCELGEVYLDAGREEEAAVYLEKAKRACESMGGEVKGAEYGVVNLGLGKLYLKQGRLEECRTRCQTVLGVLERDEGYEEEVVEAWEVLWRCGEAAQNREYLRWVGEQCERRLKQIKEETLLLRMVKLSLNPHLSQTTPQKASLFLDFLSTLPTLPAQSHILALQLFRQRIAEQTLISCLKAYLIKVQAITAFITQGELLSRWDGLGQLYPRQTVKDFISLMVELRMLLGDGWMEGALRQTL